MRFFVALVVAWLALLNLTTACVHLYGTIGKDSGHREGKVIDNGIQTCDCSGQNVPEPGWCSCIEGYHAFITLVDQTTFAYDTPHSKDMRLRLYTWYTDEDFTVAYDQWVWC